MLDRMRETLFNILQWEIEGARFADLYAGTGAVGIEALSRGAASAVFVDTSPQAFKVIRENLASVGAKSEARVILGDVAETLPSIDADYYFAGPPYAAHDEYGKILRLLGERPCRAVIVQHGRSLELPGIVGDLARERAIRMGSNVLTIYRPQDSQLRGAASGAAEPEADGVVGE